MSCFVSIFLPHLPIERLKRRERSGAPFPVDRPLALVGNEERGLLLTALNAASLSAKASLPASASPMPAPSARTFSPLPAAPEEG